MPASNFNDYAQNLVGLFESALESGQAVAIDQTVDQRSAMRGFIAGTAYFEDGSELHFREYVDVSQAEPRLMYAYHYQTKDHELIFRYDNAAHRPALSQPDHKHVQDQISLLPEPPSVEAILDEILN